MPPSLERPRSLFAPLTYNAGMWFSGLQRSKRYWQTRAAILRASFYVGRALFRIRAKATEFRTSFRVAAALTFSVLLPVATGLVIAGLSEYVGRVIERNASGTRLGVWFARLHATQSYVAPYAGTILQVLATLIGLYFTAVSLVASNAYAGAPSRIRALILEDKVSNVYVRALVLTTTLSAYVFVGVSLGAPVTVLTTILIPALLVFCVSSFWSLGLRTFHFFDASALAGSLSGRLVQWVNYASAAGFRWLDQSFQNHYRRQAEELLRNFSALADVAGRGRGSPVIVFAHLNQLLSWYAERKTHIPGDSYWFRRERAHRGWFSSDDSTISLALNAGTVLHADEPPNLNWFEEDILDIFRKNWRLLSQESDSAVAGFLDHLRATNGRMCEAYAVEEGRLVMACISEIAEEYSAKLTGSLGVPGQPPPPTEPLLVVQALGLSVIEAVLGFRRSLPTLVNTPPRAADITRSERWPRLFNLQLPRLVASDAEAIARKIAFERSVEGDLVTPEWYVTELLAGSSLRFLKDSANGILQSLELMLANAERWVEQKRYLAAAHVSASGLEAVNKFAHAFTDVLGAVQTLEQHKTQLGLQWPAIDPAVVQPKLAAMRRRFALLLAESAARAPLVALGGEFPDYLGQAFNVCFDIAFDALLDGDDKVFNQCATWLFVLGPMADERLRPKSATPYDLSVATVPMMMLMELSAYAFVLGAVRGKNFGLIVHRLWDLHIARFADQAAVLERLAAILSYRRAQLLTIMHGDVQRTGRERRVEQFLSERGLLRDPYDRYRRRSGAGASIPHVPHLIRALEGRLSFHHMVDVFAAVYLLGHGVDSKKVPREARQLAERLQREAGFAVAEDEDEDESG
jgi:hypothetical protein